MSDEISFLPSKTALLPLTKTVSEASTECNLLYELGFDGISNGPSSNQLRDDFFAIMSEKMKKLKLELLEIDLRRQELNKSALEVDAELDLQEAASNGRRGSRTNTNKNWFTNMIAFKREPVQIKNEKVNRVLSECDERIVELSNIFLNEKIDLIFKHTREIGELNRQIAVLSRQLARMKIVHTEADVNEENFDKFFQFEAQTQTDDITSPYSINDGTFGNLDICSNINARN